MQSTDPGCCSWTARLGGCLEDAAAYPVMFTHRAPWSYGKHQSIKCNISHISVSGVFLKPGCQTGSSKMGK